MSEYNFTPRNIFLCRDFATLTDPINGVIKIDIEDHGAGWRAYRVSDHVLLISGQDVYSMCAWLIQNQVTPKFNP